MMQEYFLESHGIYYRTSDFQPNRKTLVFIHGLSGSSSVWLPFEERFEREYNILTFDLRGHGKSRKYKKYRDYELHELAEDAYALLRELRIEQCVVISHSLGSLVALELLHEHAALFSKAIFISPAAETPKLFFFHLKHPVNAAAGFLGFLLSVFKKRDGHTNYALFRESGDWSVHRILTDIANTGMRPYLYSLNHLYGFSHEEWWSDITIPILILHGTKDTMVPATYASALAKKISSAKLQLFRNKNHLLPLNSIDEVSRATEEFLA